MYCISAAVSPSHLLMLGLWGSAPRMSREGSGQAPSHDPRIRGPGVQRVLDRYDIVDRLHSAGAVASGGHASVFVAEDRTTGQLVAVKRQQTPSDTVAREFRFFRNTRQHEHPNLMRLLDSFIWPYGSDMCFVFEHMDGTLWEWWRRRRGVGPLRSVQQLARQATAGLQHLHELDIVHADLSMANMLLTEDLHLRITDLGGAVASVDGRVTAPSHVGTTEYVRAPEVILRCPQTTQAIDAWALGVVCMGLLCGSLVVWRDARHDTPHPDLPMSDGRSDGLDGLQTIGNTARLLGPLPAGLWQELACWKLGTMQESPYGQAASCASLRPTLSGFLTDSLMVKRCVDVDSPGLDFVAGLLRWRPTERRRATRCGSHAWFRDEQVSLPLAEEALLGQVSATALQGLVRRSLHTGLPIRLEDLVGGVGSAPQCGPASPVGGAPQCKKESPGSVAPPPVAGSEVSLTQEVPGRPGASEWWLRSSRSLWRQGSIRQGAAASPPASAERRGLSPSPGGSTLRRPPVKRRRCKGPEAIGEGGSAASGTQVAPATLRAGRAAPKGRQGRRQRAQAPSHGTPFKRPSASQSVVCSQPSASQSVVGSQSCASQSVINPPFKRPSRRARTRDLAPLTQAQMWQLAFNAASDEDDSLDIDLNEACQELEDELWHAGPDLAPQDSPPPGQPSPLPAASPSPPATCLSQSPVRHDPFLAPSHDDPEPCIAPGESSGTSVLTLLGQTPVPALPPVADVAPTSRVSARSRTPRGADRVRSPSEAALSVHTPPGPVPGDPLDGKCRCRGGVWPGGMQVREESAFPETARPG